MSVWNRIKDFGSELRDRSRGRKAMGNDKQLFRSARGIVGATGWSFSSAWNYLERDGGKYARSMDPNRHIPPSIFISERDRTRQGVPMPLVERCLEDMNEPDAMPVGEWDIAELSDD